MRLKVYSKIMGILFDILKWVTAIIMLFMVILTFVEVLRRYFLSTNWAWSEELVRYLTVWCTFLGGAAAFRAGALVCFDLVLLKFSAKVQAVLGLITNSVILALIAFLFKLSLEAVTKPSVVGQFSAALGFSMFWPYVSIPIGLGVMILFIIEHYGDLVKNCKAAFGSQPNSVEQKGGAA